MNSDDLDMGELAKSRVQILTHPLYTNILKLHFECRKVGLNPEDAHRLDSLLDGLLKEALPAPSHYESSPEIDAFMANYLGMLEDYKSELEKPFREARIICESFEEKLKQLSVVSNISEISGETEEEKHGDAGEAYGSGGEEDESIENRYVEDEKDNWNSGSVDPWLDDEELKEQLKKKYMPYLSSLKQDYLKKKKKGKLPKESTQTLLEWWHAHVKWPYPSEAEKVELTKVTGLDSKQINNWFINQRKRHWNNNANNGLRKGAGARSN